MREAPYKGSPNRNAPIGLPYEQTPLKFLLAGFLWRRLLGGLTTTVLLRQRIRSLVGIRRYRQTVQQVPNRFPQVGNKRLPLPQQ